MSVGRILEDVKDLQRANEYLKSQVKVMKEIIENAGGAAPRHCKSCKHFIQHYVKYDDYHYSELDCGHCVMRGKGIKRRGDKHADGKAEEADTFSTDATDDSAADCI